MLPSGYKVEMDKKTRRNQALRKQAEQAVVKGAGFLKKKTDDAVVEDRAAEGAAAKDDKRGDEKHSMQQEVALMKKMSHPHVLRLFEVIDDPMHKELYLVLEHMDKGDLLTHQGGAKALKCRPMSEAHIKFTFKQVCL